MTVFLIWFARFAVESAGSLALSQITLFALFLLSMVVGIVECWRKAKQFTERES